MWPPRLVNFKQHNAEGNFRYEVPRTSFLENIQFTLVSKILSTFPVLFVASPDRSGNKYLSKSVAVLLTQPQVTNLTV